MEKKTYLYPVCEMVSCNVESHVLANTYIQVPKGDGSEFDGEFSAKDFSSDNLYSESGYPNIEVINLWEE